MSFSIRLNKINIISTYLLQTYEWHQLTTRNQQYYVGNMSYDNFIALFWELVSIFNWTVVLTTLLSASYVNDMQKLYKCEICSMINMDLHVSFRHMSFHIRQHYGKVQSIEPHVTGIKNIVWFGNWILTTGSLPSIHVNTQGTLDGNVSPILNPR